MATLQVRDLDDKLYESLRRRANQEKRSISQEVVTILEKYLSQPNAYESNPTDEFLMLAGAWRDERSADEIITEIRGSRKNSSRFLGDPSVFD